MTSFFKRRLRLTVTLATGNFGGSGDNQLIIEGLRSVCAIQHAGGQMMSTAALQIFGMRQQDMNQLTVLAWRALSIVRNTVKIEAADESDAYSEVFNGQIVNAWAEYGASPEVFFHIEAQAAFFEQINPTDALSYTGPTDVATIMDGLAKQMNLAFENNGVNTQLSSPYLPNTALEQAKAVAKAAGIDMYIDGSTLAICPKGVARNGQIPLINAGSGLIGYPTFDKIGIAFLCLWNPAIVFGGQIKLETTVQPAAGTWRVYAITHQLESERPDGAWHSAVRATENGLVPIAR